MQHIIFGNYVNNASTVISFGLQNALANVQFVNIPIDKHVIRAHSRLPLDIFSYKSCNITGSIAIMMMIILHCHKLRSCSLSCHLSIKFLFVHEFLTASIACHKSAVRKGTQYNLPVIVFSNISNICGSPYPNNAAHCLILLMLISSVYTFSSKWNVLDVCSSDS